jgi:hypothetical protein
MNNPYDTNNSDGGDDPSSNEFQNLFSDGTTPQEEEGVNNYGMQLDDNVGNHLAMQLNQHRHRQQLHPLGGRVVNFDVDETIEGGDNDVVINAAVEAVPPPPPLPPPIGVNNVTGGGSGAVVIPSNNEEQREDVIAVNDNNHNDGEEVMIGPRQQPQQQPVQEEEEVEEEGGAPIEVVKLWEEVAFGLEKQQTGKFVFVLFVCQELLWLCLALLLPPICLLA